VSRAVLSIGSNLGDRAALLRTAVAEFADVLRATSPVYETAPWGGVPQEPFLNAVLLVAGDETPAEWLARAHKAEGVAGRERTEHWGPRTLDVDIVHIDGVLSEDPELRLPHPLAHERAFVLVPWFDVDPSATLSGRPLCYWLSIVDSSGISRREDVDIGP